MYLRQQPSVFLRMRGLRVAACEDMLREGKPLLAEGAVARLQRADGQGGLGGGRAAELNAGDPILMTVIGLGP